MSITWRFTRCDKQRDLLSVREIGAGKRFYLGQKFVANPLSDKVARCADLNQTRFQFNSKRTNPGVELLRVEFPLKMGEAVTPEIVHVQRGMPAEIKSEKGVKMGTKILNLY